MAANIAEVRLTLDDGTDLSDRINPRLIDLTLTEKRGEKADELQITLHNHDGKLAPPKTGVFLSLAMGWRQGNDVTPGLVDKGRFKVDEVERGGPPDIVSIRARSADLTGDYRKRRDQVWKDKTLGAILTEIAGRNALTASVHPDLASTQIQSIAQSAKSDMAFVADLGRRYDAVASVKNKTLVFMPVGSATTASGAAIPALTLARRDGWSWKFTYAQRSEHDGAEAQWHDQDEAKTKTVKTGGNNRKRLKKTYASEADANAAAKAEADKNKRGAKCFDYDLALGDPAIAVNSKVTLNGWDSEIDGTNWLVEEASHKFGSSGLSTSIRLESAD